MLLLPIIGVIKILQQEAENARLFVIGRWAGRAPVYPLLVPPKQMLAGQWDD